MRFVWGHLSAEWVPAPRKALHSLMCWVTGSGPAFEEIEGRQVCPFTGSDGNSIR